MESNKKKRRRRLRHLRLCPESATRVGARKVSSSLIPRPSINYTCSVSECSWNETSLELLITLAVSCTYLLEAVVSSTHTRLLSSLSSA